MIYHFFLLLHIDGTVSRSKYTCISTALDIYLHAMENFQDELDVLSDVNKKRGMPEVRRRTLVHHEYLDSWR